MDEQNIKADSHWSELLTERNQLLVKLCIVYSNRYSEAGDVGHNYKLLIAQLAEILDRVTEKAGVSIPSLYEPEA